MNVRLSGFDRGSIPIISMEDGQLGVVVEFPCRPSMVGVIIHRTGEGVFILGKHAAAGWPTFYDQNVTPFNEGHRVRLLKPGDVLEIVE